MSQEKYNGQSAKFFKQVLQTTALSGSLLLGLGRAGGSWSLPTQTGNQLPSF